MLSVIISSVVTGPMKSSLSEVLPLEGDGDTEFSAAKFPPYISPDCATVLSHEGGSRKTKTLEELHLHIRGILQGQYEQED